MNPYTTWFVLFTFLGYFIVTDSSVAKLVVLLTRLLKFQFQKYKWIILHHPKTPWAQYVMWRRSMKLAKELIKEFENK
jgi:hypothetical protein